MAEGKIYKLPDGRLLWAGPGIGSEVFFTYTTRRSGRGQQRYKSQSLPLRDSLQEAQSDLDLYARKNKLEPDHSNDLVKLKCFDPDPAA